MEPNQLESDKSLERVSLILVVISSFLIPFMGSSLSIALPLIQSSLSVDILFLGWIPLAFILANAALVLPFGRLADIHGRKKIFTWGVVIYTCASLMAGLSNSGLILIVFSFIQGLGCAMIFATAVALLISIFPHERRGEVLGINVTAVYVGLFMGPLLGGFLAQQLGWRSIYFANVPVGLFALMIILTSFRGEWKSSDGEKFEKLNALIYIASLSILMYGVSALHDFNGKILLFVGIIGLLFFYTREKSSKNPIIPLDIFKNKMTRISGVTLLLITVATSATWTLLSLYLQDILNLQPFETALILSLQPLAVIILSPLVGRWADEGDNWTTIILGAVISTIGLVIMIFLNNQNELILVSVGFLLTGIGLGLFSAPTNKNFLESLTNKYYGVGSATLSTMLFIGQSVSLGLLLFILTGYMGNVQIAPGNFSQFMDGLHATFIVFSVLGLITFIITLRIRKNTDVGK